MGWPDARGISDRGIDPLVWIDPYLVDVELEKPSEPTPDQLDSYLSSLGSLYTEAMRSEYPAEGLKIQGGIISVAGYDIDAVRAKAVGGIWPLAYPDLKLKEALIKEQWSRYESAIRSAIASRGTWPVLKEFFAKFGNTKPNRPYSIADLLIRQASDGPYYSAWEEEFVRVRGDWNTLMSMPERASIGMTFVGINMMIWPPGDGVSIRSMDAAATRVEAASAGFQVLGAARTDRSTASAVPKRIDTLTDIAPVRSPRALASAPENLPAAGTLGARVPDPSATTRMTADRFGTGTSSPEPQLAPDPAVQEIASKPYADKPVAPADWPLSSFQETYPLVRYSAPESPTRATENRLGAVPPTAPKPVVEKTSTAADAEPAPGSQPLATPKQKPVETGVDVINQGWGTPGYRFYGTVSKPLGVEVVVTPEMLRTGSRLTQRPAGWFELTTPNRGHLLANVLGGPNVGHNNVSLERAANSPVMSQFEQAIKNSVEKTGRPVSLVVVPKYVPGRESPESVIMSFRDATGWEMAIEIENSAQAIVTWIRGAFN